jgi:Domain of unknown function (DUF4124)
MVDSMGLRIRAIGTILLLLTVGVASAQSSKPLYRHVDEKGNITFSDRPSKAHQAPEKLPPPNVASPEVSRQIEAENSAMLRRVEQERELVRRGREEREAMNRTPSPPPRSGKFDPNLPDSQRPEDTSRRTFR